ncbi:hypothetical protein BDR07DRAFT_1315052, partial [Suillus spraguei]
IGPQDSDLTLGTLPNNLTATIPTITDHLHDQGKIGQRVVSIFFQAVTMNPDTYFGEVTFGGTDHTKYAGNVAYT